MEENAAILKELKHLRLNFNNFQKMVRKNESLSVTSFDMKFWAMVVFMVKISFTAIPAGIIVMIFYLIFWGVIVGLVSQIPG